MKTEHWSLVIAIVALLSSIGLPVWFRRQDTKERVAEKRSLLLQKILSVKSLSCSSRMQLTYMLQRYGNRMEDIQRQALIAQLANIKEHEKEIWNIHEECSDYNDNSTLKDLDETMKHVAVAESEAVDTVDMIEKGIKSYE